MNLQSAFYAAKSALFVNSAESALVARNIAGAGDSAYARRTLLLETAVGGVVRSSSVSRSTDAALQEAMLASRSKAAADNVASRALDALQARVGGPLDNWSPAALVGSLQVALRQAAAAPQDAASLAAAVNAAKRLASGLNAASAQTQATRAQADASLRASAEKAQSLLDQFEGVNAAIVSGRAAGADVSDALDQRDSILGGLAQEIGIKTVADPNGGMSIYTDSGVPLFQGVARRLSIEPATGLSAGATGANVFADGVAIVGPSATMPAQSGAMVGFAHVRDVAAPTFQRQLDEVARGLIGAFVQSDQSSTPTGPDRTGLFSWPDSPAPPGGPVAGLSGMIAVDPTVDPDSGGDVTLLRDGGIGGAGGAYVYNPGGGAGYAAHLSALADELDAKRSFDEGAGIGASASLASFAADSAGWLEASRRMLADASAQSSATASQAQSAFGDATGVNIDDQMTLMLNLEHSYQASAKMMATIDSMYSVLFNSLTVA